MSLYPEIVRLFDRQGNCPTLGDPYRKPGKACEILFDEDGELTMDAESAIQDVINKHGETLQPLCDAVVLLISSRFSANTKGLYPTIYYWR